MADKTNVTALFIFEFHLWCGFAESYLPKSGSTEPS